MHGRIYALALAALLTGCAQSATESTPPPESQASCNNDGLSGFIGQKASATLGEKILAASGARTLRWGPPRSAMTMDFRHDRLTVSYDDSLTITSAHCG
jgi:hypothetical protein